MRLLKSLVGVQGIAPLHHFRKCLLISRAGEWSERDSNFSFNLSLRSNVTEAAPTWENMRHNIDQGEDDGTPQQP